MTTTRTRAQILELAEELADARQHIEPVTSRDRWRNKTMRAVWVTSQPGLLDQLADITDATGSNSDSPNGRPHPGSRPPGRWEALSEHARISVEVYNWVHELGLDAADTATGNVRALANHAAHLDDADADALLADMRRWRHTCAVLTGWATRMWAPNVGCPIADCGRTTSLRIHLDRRLAYCGACRAQWEDEDGSYAMLAAYIAGTASPTERRQHRRLRSSVAGHGGWLTTSQAGE